MSRSPNVVRIEGYIPRKLKDKLQECCEQKQATKTDVLIAALHRYFDCECVDTEEGEGTNHG